MTAPETRSQLPVAEVIELTELLQFIDDWLTTCHDQLSEPFARFADHPAYGISHLRADLQRLAFSSAPTTAPTSSASSTGRHATS